MISTKEYIDQLHARVRKMREEKLSEEEIIAALVAEGMTPYYAQTLIDNIKEDEYDRKAFRKLLVIGILAILVAAFLLFDSFRTGRLFLWFFLGSLGAGVVMIYRAITIFKK